MKEPVENSKISGHKQFSAGPATLGQSMMQGIFSSSFDETMTPFQTLEFLSRQVADFTFHGPWDSINHDLQNLIVTHFPNPFEESFLEISREVAFQIYRSMLSSKALICEFIPDWIDLGSIMIAETDEKVIHQEIFKNRKLIMEKARKVLTSFPRDEVHLLEYKQGIMAMERGLYAPAQALFANLVDIIEKTRISKSKLSQVNNFGRELQKSNFSVEAFSAMQEWVKVKLSTEEDKASFYILLWTQLPTKTVMQRYNAESTSNRNATAHRGGAYYSRFNALILMIASTVLLEASYQSDSLIFLKKDEWVKF